MISLPAMVDARLYVDCSVLADVILGYRFTPNLFTAFLFGWVDFYLHLGCNRLHPSRPLPGVPFAMFSTATALQVLVRAPGWPVGVQPHAPQR